MAAQEDERQMRYATDIAKHHDSSFCRANLRHRIITSSACSNIFTLGKPAPEPQESPLHARLMAAAKPLDNVKQERHMPEYQHPI